MNPTELRRLEDEFREALSGSALEWILDEVDAAIADGVPEEKILRRRRTARTGDVSDIEAEAARYETVPRLSMGEVGYEAAGKSGTVVITTRPLEADERLKLLLDALRRVFVELPAIEFESLKALADIPDGDDGERAAVSSVRFVADEETPRRGQRAIELSDSRWIDERERLTGLFDASAEEVTL